MTMRLDNLKPRPGSKRRSKRLGAGDSSGRGKTSGKGEKGQTSRSGGSIRIGFEGGQMPLYRRIPKRGFNNTAFGTALATVNVSQLNDFEDGTEVTPSLLIERGVLKKLQDGLKILGDGELKRKLTVSAQRFSASARDKIAKAGGSCIDLPLPGIRCKPKTGKPARSRAAKDEPTAES
jgi:large subunit ribosomal protein L15